MIEWSPNPVIHYDFHITLPLTTRLLALLKTSHISPLLISIFGSTICGRGDLHHGVHYTIEAREIAAQFPPISIFPPDSIIHKFTKAIPDDRYKPVAFILAITGVSGRSVFTASDNVIIVAMRQELEDMDPIVLQKHIFDMILVLIHWEWEDRSKMALSYMNLGFKFTVVQAKVIWLLMASKNLTFRNEVIHLLRKNRGLWYTVEAMNTNCQAAPYDLATFVYFLHSIYYSSSVIEEREWMKKVRIKYHLLDWTTTDVIRYIICLLATSFGTKALVYYYLTTNQLEPFLTEKGEEDCIISPEDFFQDIILLVSDQPPPPPPIPQKDEEEEEEEEPSNQTLTVSETSNI